MFVVSTFEGEVLEIISLTPRDNSGPYMGTKCNRDLFMHLLGFELCFYQSSNLPTKFKGEPTNQILFVASVIKLNFILYHFGETLENFSPGVFSKLQL